MKSKYIISKADGTTQKISNNTVYNLENTTTSTTVKFETYGIYLDGPTSSNTIISRNFVHTFIVPTGSSAGTYLHGISLYDGDVTLTNNIVYLGNNISIGCSIWGLWTNSNDSVKIYHMKLIRHSLLLHLVLKNYQLKIVGFDNFGILYQQQPLP